MYFGHINLYHLQKYGSAKKYYQLAILHNHEFEKDVRNQLAIPDKDEVFEKICETDVVISRCSREMDSDMQKIDERYRKE